MLQKAVTEGYGKTLSEVGYISPDWEMISHLKYNVGVFAAFKNHHQIEETVKLLIDDNGEARSWEDFKNAALALNTRYNSVWLKTEYHLAKTSAKAARRWQDIQRTKHIYPNLIYVAVNDGRTRELHKKWHGIILPVDHVFWNTHYIPNDHGCRCNVFRTDKAVDTKGYNVENMPELPPMFNQNTGKTGVVFDKSHPYFKIKNYKNIADMAHKAIMNIQTQQIKQYIVKQQLLDKSFNSQLGKVKILPEAVDRILQQKTENSYQLNAVFYDLKNVIKNALYIKTKEKKGSKYHFLHLQIKNKNVYLTIKEEDEKYQLYNITDKL
ncbi:hypothetical protein HN014_08055 [Aquimarina sp. TRL1]|uniref:phage head morphogenesis protein n=1 Tax=Aquimarina sp. (strain TRL1) TaxID=2736252 RepID=UPI00158C7E01|nr:phage minor head protein [Aquimarina sp. TRL1]QKX04871.1 hypothetical protein HN014_08055 [Aquimarina sp. TRL1]